MGGEGNEARLEFLAKHFFHPPLWRESERSGGCFSRMYILSQKVVMHLGVALGSRFSSNLARSLCQQSKFSLSEYYICENGAISLHL